MMNNTERADMIRGYKVVGVVILLIFIVSAWQSTGYKFLYPVLIFLCIAVVVWALSMYRNHRTLITSSADVPAARTLSVTVPAGRPPLPLIERRKDIVEAYRNQLRLSGAFEVENLVRDCIGYFAAQEGRTDLVPGREYLYRWRQRSDIPEEYRKLAEDLETDFRKRANDLEKDKELQTVLRAEKMLADNWDLVEKFLHITERKVSVLDDYGDEQWSFLPDEVLKCLKKIDEREHLVVHWESIKKSKGTNWERAIWSISVSLPAEYKWMVEKLQQLFQEHHERNKWNIVEGADLQNLSGIEFETHIGKRLRIAGYEVQGTPTTGDQGADLIAQKDSRKIIIQAKRYLGTVGVKAVQEVIAAVSFYGGDEGWVVTNSCFTPSAVALAQKANIKLIDGTALRDKSII